MSSNRLYSGVIGSENLRTVREMVDRFKQENDNGITVEFRRASQVADEYFRNLVSNFQTEGRRRRRDRGGCDLGPSLPETVG